MLRDTRPELKRLTLTQLLSNLKGWHGTRLNQPDWGNHSHSVALSAELPKENLLAHCIFNAYWEPLEFELPSIRGAAKNHWKRWIDTSLESPQDISEWHESQPVDAYTYCVGPRSVAVFWANLP
jgi:glycogen operon protein